MLVFTRMTTTMLQSLPLVTMYFWLSFNPSRDSRQHVFLHHDANTFDCIGRFNVGGELNFLVFIFQSRRR